LAQIEPTEESLDRRALIKIAAGGLAAGGLLAEAAQRPVGVVAAFVPNNFRAVVHITRQEDFAYAFSSLDTIAQHYKKASGRLILDGDAVKGLTDDDILGQLKSAKDAGAEIVAASDALSINGIDPSSLPSYVKSDNPGVIAVVDAQVKGYHYYKL
jgi:intracellular sulfur oxidation DsrE/DsrF family protein